MAAAPARAVNEIVCDAPLGSAPDGWAERVSAKVTEAAARLYRPLPAPGSPGAVAARDRLARFAMGLAMDELRGQVAALEVNREIEKSVDLLMC
jgi:hypothetical protein